MENPPINQLFEFIASVIWGGVIGVLYEVLGILRFGKKWRIAIVDLLFWMLTCISTFVFLLAVNGGEPRGFMLVGIAGGAVIIRLTAGSALHRLKNSARERHARRKARKKRKKIDLGATLKN